MKDRIIRLALWMALASGTLCAQVNLAWQSMFTSPSSNWAFALNPQDHRILYTQKNGVFYVSHDRGVNWEARGNCPQQEVRNISVSAIDTNSILLCSFGLWKSNDGGWTWREVLPGVVLDGETIDYNYQNPATIYFADFFSSAFYVSHDTGSTWTQTSTIGYGYVCTLSSNPSDSTIIIAGAGDTRIARSTNSGATWQLVKTGNPYFSEVPKLVWDKVDHHVAYAAIQLDENYSIFKSTDYGATWFDIGMYGVYMWGMDMNPATGDLYVGAFLDDGNVRGVYRSSDQARSWQRLGSAPFDYVWMIKAANDGYVYSLEGADAIYRINANGLGKRQGVLTDSISGLPIPYASVIVEETGDSIIINNGDGHYAVCLLPGTYHLRFQSAGVQKTIAGVVFQADSSNELSVTLPIGLQNVTLDGVIQNSVLQPIAANVEMHGRRGNGLPFVASDTTDGSGVFEFLELNSLDFLDSLMVKPLMLPYSGITLRNLTPGHHTIEVQLADVLIVNDADEPWSVAYENALTQVGISHATWNTFDRGLSIPVDLVGQTSKQAVVWFTNDANPVLSPAEQDTLTAICARGYDLLLAGMNLAEVNTSSTLFLNQLGVGFNSNYAGASSTIRGFNGNIISDGVNMAITPSLQPSRDVIDLLNPYVHKCLRYGGTAADSNKFAGAYIENTGSGGKAVFFGFDLHQAPATALRTLLQRSIAYFDQIVAVDPNDDVHPASVTLYQNHPNPFNPTTRIEFTLSRPTQVTLKVYNVMGQEVRQLVTGAQASAGQHHVFWDGRNDDGVPVSSGVYLYRLMAGDVVKTRRMILMK